MRRALPEMSQSLVSLHSKVVWMESTMESFPNLSIITEGSSWAFQPCVERPGIYIISFLFFSFSFHSSQIEERTTPSSKVKYLAKIFCLGRNVSCMIIKLLLLLVV
jgi:hypothetical protein